MKSDYGGLYKSKLSPSSLYHPYMRPVDNLTDESKLKCTKELRKDLEEDLTPTANEINILAKPFIKAPVVVSIPLIII